MRKDIESNQITYTLTPGEVSAIRGLYGPRAVLPLYSGNHLDNGSLAVTFDTTDHMSAYNLKDFEMMLSILNLV